MDPAQLQSLLGELRAVIAALHAGEAVRANELLETCKVPELAASGAIPAGPEGAELRAAVEEALQLAMVMQTTRRKAVAQGGASRRALGAYGARKR